MIVMCSIGWSHVEIWTGLGPTFMAVQQAGLKTQECQHNLSTVYIGRNQNSINNICAEPPLYRIWKQSKYHKQHSKNQCRTNPVETMDRALTYQPAPSFQGFIGLLQTFFCQVKFHCKVFEHDYKKIWKKSKMRQRLV